MYLMTSTHVKYISQTQTHTQTVYNKFIDMKKIQLKKGEMLATISPPHKTAIR
jgi:hypothetical protein